MKRIETGNPERLIYRECYDFLFCFRVFWFVVAVLLLVAVVAGPCGWFFGTGQGHLWGMIGLSFVVVGFPALVILGKTAPRIGRMAVVIDKQRGTVTAKSGPIWPIFPDRHPLSAYTNLAIRRRVYQTRNLTEHEYELLLSGINRVAPLKIGRGSGYTEIRTMAEDVGKVVRLDVIDQTGPTAVVLKCEDLGKPLQTTARDSLADVTLPPPPEGTRLEYDIDASRIEIRFRRVEHGQLIGVALLLAVDLAFLIAMLFQSPPLNPGTYVATAIGAFLLYLYFAFASVRVTVSIDPRALKMVETGWFGMPRPPQEIPLDQLKELRRHANQVEVIYRDGTWTLSGGDRISNKEAQWICEVITQVVSG